MLEQAAQNDESKGLDELQLQVVEENKVGEICLDLGREGRKTGYYPFVMNRLLKSGEHSNNKEKK